MGKKNSERTAIGNWLVGVAEYFNHFAHKDERADHAYNEVGDIVKGNYDAQIQKGEGLSR